MDGQMDRQTDRQKEPPNLPVQMAPELLAVSPGVAAVCPTLYAAPALSRWLFLCVSCALTAPGEWNGAVSQFKNITSSTTLSGCLIALVLVMRCIQSR